MVSTAWTAPPIFFPNHRRLISDSVTRVEVLSALSGVPFVVTTFGGVGAAAFRDFVRSIYVARAARLIASGATGAAAAREFFDLQCRIQATVVRSLSLTLAAHTRP